MRINLDIKKDQKVWFISDLHDMHANCILYDKRPFADTMQQHNILIQNWNRCVRKGDIVFIIGDLSFKIGHAEDLLKRLNGKKYLIVGNHDYFAKKESFDRTLLEGIFDLCEVKLDNYHIVMCHYPLEVWNRRHYGSIHIHGHIHNNEFRKIANRYNVNASLIGYTPIDLTSLINLYGYEKININESNLYTVD